LRKKRGFQICQGRSSGWFEKGQRLQKEKRFSACCPGRKRLIRPFFGPRPLSREGGGGKTVVFKILRERAVVIPEPKNFPERGGGIVFFLCGKKQHKSFPEGGKKASSNGGGGTARTPKKPLGGVPRKAHKVWTT